MSVKKHTVAKFAALFFALVFIVGAICLGLSNVSPKVNATYSTGETTTLSSHRARCNTNVPVDFSIKVTIIGFDTNSGTVTYDTEMIPQRCLKPDGSPRRDTSAYAVFGDRYCNFAGWYGGSESGNANDCVKYVGSPGYTPNWNRLNCPSPPAPGPTNAGCLTPYGQGIVVENDQPGTGTGGAKTARLSLTVNNWDTKKQDRDSHTFNLGEACQYFKYNEGSETGFPQNTGERADSDPLRNQNSAWRRCESGSITVSWAPHWSESVSTDMTINGAARSGTEASPDVVYVGDSVVWNHRLVNNGPDRREANINWRIYQNDNGNPSVGPSTVIDSPYWSWDRNPGESISRTGTFTPQVTNAGQRRCQANSADPAAYNNPGWIGTQWKCIRVKYYRITPSIDPSNDTFIGEPANARGRINHIGSLEDAHEVKLVAYKYDDTRVKTSGALGARSSSGEAPCSIGALRSAAIGFQDCRESSPAIGDYNGANPMGVERPFSSFGFSGPHPLGTTFCFVLSVRNPAERPEDDANWYHSEASCTTSAKKPRVQFLGSDLRVAGSAISVESNIGGTTYGSWVEYGAFSTDINNFVGSGNALREGDTGARSDWSELTFANDENPAMTPYGFYDPLPAPTSAYGYFTSLTRNAVLNDTVIPNGVYDVGSTIGNGLARLGETKGGSVIIRSDENLTISQNIAVNNDNLTNADQITQVVIVADNITIDPGVTRIDAWLVTADGGFINTCAGSGALTANGPCREQLVVNGAVYTDQLQLRRTAGSDPESTDDLKRGAEVFNLRPDSVLWSYLYASKGDFPKTDFIQELPPRY